MTTAHYSEVEEILHALSHGAGALLSLLYDNLAAK